MDMKPNEVKHLEMIQNIVDRMNRNSFQVKALTTVILAGVFTVFSRIKYVEILYVTIIPVILLWVLDSFYLQTERKFIELYSDIVKGTRYKSKNVFDMNLDGYNGYKNNLLYSMFVSINCLIYLLIIVLLIGIGVYLKPKLSV